MTEEEQDREGLMRQLRSEAKRLRELPAETPYQLVVSSVDAVVLGSLLDTAADALQRQKELEEAVSLWGQRGDAYKAELDNALQRQKELEEGLSEELTRLAQLPMMRPSLSEALEVTDGVARALRNLLSTHSKGAE